VDPPKKLIFEHRRTETSLANEAGEQLTIALRSLASDFLSRSGK
jgi:hypothetical protein